jgi:hypothetical protein
LLNATSALLSAALVAAVTLIGRRWGARAAGWMSGLPVVVGPILIVLALQHGGDFAARAANGALIGLLTVPAFVVTYAWASRRTKWPLALAAGWIPAAAIALAIESTAAAPLVSLLLVGVALTAAAAALPASGTTAPVRGELAIRCALTAAVVWTSTQSAALLGPELSGVVASLPLLAAILATFTHAQAGSAAAATLLRGMLTGLGSYAALCFVVAVSA